VVRTPGFHPGNRSSTLRGVTIRDFSALSNSKTGDTPVKRGVFRFPSFKLLYRYRFLNRIQIQAFLKHKDPKTINLWLKDLRAKGYLEWIYSTHFAEKTKPAIYYLGLNGIRYLRKLETYTVDDLRKRYRMKKRLENYIKYLDDEDYEWKEQTDTEKLPILLFVCPRTSDLIYAKRRTRGLIAETWERDDEDRPDVRLTTADKLKQSGIFAKEIWERA
jgi:hypothetical protein